MVIDVSECLYFPHRSLILFYFIFRTKQMYLYIPQEEKTR